MNSFTKHLLLIIMTLATTIACRSSIKSRVSTGPKSTSVPFMSSMAFAQTSELHSCTTELENQLVYIQETDLFQVCRSGAWVTIIPGGGRTDVAGPTGATGAVGAKGDTGPPGIGSPAYGASDSALADSVFVGSNGYIGIGNTTPASPFHIGTGLDWYGLTLDHAVTGGAGTLKWSPPGIYGPGRFLLLSNETHNGLGTGEDGGIVFRVNSGPGFGNTLPAMTITQNRNVGIVTTSPKARLGISGGGDIITTLDIQTGGCGTANQAVLAGGSNLSNVAVGDAFVDEAGGRFTITAFDDAADTVDFTGTCTEDGSNDAFVHRNGLVVQSGNVGIGTTTPKDSLEVAGNIRVNNFKTISVSGALPTDSADVLTLGTIEFKDNADGIVRVSSNYWSWNGYHVPAYYIIPFKSFGTGTWIVPPTVMKSHSGKTLQLEISISGRRLTLKLRVKGPLPAPSLPRTKTLITVEGPEVIDFTEDMSISTIAEPTLLYTPFTQVGDYVGIGTNNPNSELEVAGYIQLDTIGSAPPPGDCDVAAKSGRMKYDDVGKVLYICDGSSWQSH